MDDQSRSSWRKISPQIRTKIVQSMKSSPSSYSSVQKKNINLHDITLHDLLANYHHTGDNDPESSEKLTTDHTATVSDETTLTGTNADSNDQLIVVKTAKSNDTSNKTFPGDVRHLLSTPKASGNTQVSGNVHNIIYKVTAYDTSYESSLVDRGANGGIAGNDVRIIEKLHRHVDVQGIDNHQITHIPIVTAGGVTKTQRGNIILILHQYAYVGKGTSIHSSPQIEAYHNKVDDRAIKLGGTQSITTIDGYVIPLNAKNALMRMKLRPYTK